MAALTTAGSTVFQFVRSEKRWKQRGSGNVTFSLQTDRLLVSVGDLTYVVKDSGVKAKGSKAIVMRVREDSSKSNKTKSEWMIIAVRFEREEDSQHVLTLLKLTPWFRPRKRKKQSRRRRPAFLLTMSTRQRENVRALISNAKPRFLEEGIIQKQLATVYNMSQEQIDEAIDFFHPWLTASATRRSSHQRKSTLSMTSLPSRVTDSSAKPMGTLGLGSSNRRISAVRAFPSDKSSHFVGVVGTGTNSRPGSILVNADGSQPTDQLMLESNNMKVHSSRREAESSPLHLDTDQDEKYHRNTLETDDNYPDADKPGIGEVDCKAPELDIGGIAKLGDSPGDGDYKVDAGNNLEVHRDGQKLSCTRVPSSPQHTSSSTQSRAPSPLTAHNLMLHNRLLQSSKGDFRRTVSNWLQKSLIE